jgi:nucleotide-binding universal stress UspA family protein
MNYNKCKTEVVLARCVRRFKIKTFDCTNRYTFGTIRDPFKPSNYIFFHMDENTQRSFYKILVAVDGSDASIDAAKYATQIASRYDSDLIALYVILSDISIFGPDTPTHINVLKQQAQEVLDKVKGISVDSIGNRDRKLRIRSELIGSASAVGGIVGFAEKENVDLIVVGTRGRSGFKKLLLGSVASGVVNYAHCPVLIVK